mmetsp:Transcript_6723/g.19434  ORF Transcript_6723/g.19434 Transcript_6723/m.19434 type:complete len:414 (+) Transcript_6723:1307-2548(+)
MTTTTTRKNCPSQAADIPRGHPPTHDRPLDPGPRFGSARGGSSREPSGAGPWHSSAIGRPPCARCGPPSDSPPPRSPRRARAREASSSSSSPPPIPCRESRTGRPRPRSMGIACAFAFALAFARCRCLLGGPPFPQTAGTGATARPRARPRPKSRRCNTTRSNWPRATPTKTPTTTTTTTRTIRKRTVVAAGGSNRRGTPTPTTTTTTPTTMNTRGAPRDREECRRKSAPGPPARGAPGFPPPGAGRGRSDATCPIGGVGDDTLGLGDGLGDACLPRTMAALLPVRIENAACCCRVLEESKMSISLSTVTPTELPSGGHCRSFRTSTARGWDCIRCHSLSSPPAPARRHRPRRFRPWVAGLSCFLPLSKPGAVPTPGSRRWLRQLRMTMMMTSTTKMTSMTKIVRSNRRFPQR